MQGQHFTNLNLKVKIVQNS